MFHPEDTPETTAVDIAKDVPVVDLPCGRFIPAGIITNLEIANFIPACLYVGYQVPLLDLLMINVEQYLAGWTVNCLADGVGLW